MRDPGGLFGALLDLVLPRPCPGCGGPEPWCQACASTLSGRPRQVVPPESYDEPETRSEGPPGGEQHGGGDGQGAGRIGVDPLVPLPPVYALARYRGPARAAIIAGKDHGRQDLPPRLGAALGEGLDRLIRISVISEPVWLVPAPSRRSAARERGGDPVRRMAVEAAGVLAARGRMAGVAPCLFTARGARDSVGLDAAARRRNLESKVRWIPGAAPPRHAAVVLLDDVFTTGATAGAATTAMYTHGHRVSAVVVVTSVCALR